MRMMEDIYAAYSCGSMSFDDLVVQIKKLNPMEVVREATAD